MTDEYNYIANITDLIADIPSDSIVSRTFHEVGSLKAILFGFAEGQELSEHTAARPAIIQFLQGEAELSLGDHVLEAQPGTWVYLPAQLPHGIRAISKSLMLLLLL
jgi:quercetin dioxygenase-like cupin family protein